jgi:hypothetical protein
LFLVDEGLASSRSRPCLVYPEIAHDPIHPAIEARARQPLSATAQGALDRHLTKVVRIGRIAGEPDGKPPQPRQQRQNALLELLRQRPYLSRWIKRTRGFVSSMVLYNFFERDPCAIGSRS